MRISIPLLPALLLAFVFSTAPLPAETLLQEIRQQPDQQALPRPLRGQTMDQVRRIFGPPPEVLPAVGTPPITRWRYAPFTVYFEYDRVIDSVINR